jgi:uncharacterized protein
MLDETLARTYQAALRLSPALEDTREQQRNWVKNVRDVCKDEACLAKAYIRRNAELEHARAKLPFRPNRTKPALIIPAEEAGKAITANTPGQKVELVGRLEFGHDQAGGRIDFVNGKNWHIVRYVWQVSDPANELLTALEESGAYVLVRGKLVTLSDGTKRFDDQSTVEIFSQ